MGLTELLIILTSLIAPAVLLAVAIVAGRSLRLPYVRWRGKGAGFAALAFMSVGACGCLILLTSFRPGSAQASIGASDPDAEEEPAEDGEFAVYVYPLENWAEDLRREDRGNIFARTVMDKLRKEGYSARKGVEHFIPLDIFQTDSVSESLETVYRRRVPFACVWGTLSRNRDGNLEAQISCHLLDVDLQPHELVSRVFPFGDSREALNRAADQLVQAVADTLPN